MSIAFIRLKIGGDLFIGDDLMGIFIFTLVDRIYTEESVMLELKGSGCECEISLNVDRKIGRYKTVPKVECVWHKKTGWDYGYSFHMTREEAIWDIINNCKSKVTEAERNLEIAKERLAKAKGMEDYSMKKHYPIGEITYSDDGGLQIEVYGGKPLAPMKLYARNEE